MDEICKMKKIILISVLLICAVIVEAQHFKYIKRKGMEIQNNTENTYKVELKYKNSWLSSSSVYLEPLQKMEINNDVKYLKKISVEFSYDEVCLQKDLERILKEYEKLQTKEFLGQVISAGISAFIYNIGGGVILNLLNNAENILGVISGKKDITEAATDYLIGKFTNQAIKSLNDKNKETLAVFCIGLSKIRGNVNAPHLVKRENKCYGLYNESYSAIYSLKDYINKYMGYELSIETSVPISKSYKVEYTNNLKYGDFRYNDLYPYHIKMVNSFSMFHLALGYAQSPLLYKPEETESLFFANNKAASFNNIDIGLGFNYKPLELFFSPLFEIGARNFFLNTYGYDNSIVNENGLTNITKTSSFEYYKSKVYVNVGAYIDLKYVYLFAYYSFSGSKKSVWSSQIQAGLSIPLYRKYSYY
jgi:hypothetical protein